MKERDNRSGSGVFVAGASSGIGRAVALELGAHGYDVFMFARNSSALTEVAAQIQHQGGRAYTYAGDARNPEDVGEAVQIASEKLNLGVLVNCVGSNTRMRSLTDMTLDVWQDVLSTNLTAALLMTQAVLPVFRDQRAGLLVHISSRAALQPDLSGTAYQASKAGVAALAHATYLEEKDHGIRVTVVYPGFTDTPLVLQRPVPPTADELARALQPEDVAILVAAIVEMPARAYIPDVSIYPSN